MRRDELGMAEKFDINKLNAAQREAVRELDGPVLILAGAGTGKTRTVTCRIAQMLKKGVDAKGILALTFTNKAANEMAQRVAGLVGRDVAKEMTVCTFHSLCVRILRREIGRLGYRENFTILTGGDQSGLIKRLIMELGGRQEKVEPAQVIAAYSAARNRGLTHREIEDGFIASVAEAYQKELKAQNAVDFDDLLILAERLLRMDNEVRATWQKRFTHITVDEFQDTNGLQMSLLRQLVGSARNVCVVGDDDQSIYGWRGAQISNILEFERFFPNPKIIKLEENYRCTRQVLDCANALIRHNVGRREKTLRTGKVGSEPVRVISMPGAEEEASFVADEILQVHASDRVAWEDCAVLFRANAQSRPLELALRSRHIPYRMVGSKSFFDRREVKDVLSYLHLFANPSADLHLLRVLNTPARGISQASSTQLIERSRELRKSVWSAMCDSSAVQKLNERARENVGRFVKLVKKYRAAFEQMSKSAAELTADLLSEIGYNEYVGRCCKTQEEKLQREAAINELLDTLRQAAPGPGKLADFLASVSLDNEKEEDDIEKKSGVCLITMHAAKGLEFPRVYIVGVEQGVLPHARSVDEGNLDEERRLLYVGITRAQEQLTLTYCAERIRYGKQEKCAPSEFLSEIPSDLYQFVDYERLLNTPADEQTCKDFFASMRAMLNEDEEQ